MKIAQYVLAAAAVVATVSAASAADLARKPVYKAMPVAAAYNWSGFYIGGHVGYGWGDGDVSYLGVTNSGDIDGFFGGGQIGWNWQAAGSPWVFGIEADAAFASIGRSDIAFTGTGSGDVKTIATLRGRIGYAVDRALWYVTGGYAWAQADLNINVPALGIVNAGASDGHPGYAIGGGLEWALIDNWTAKVEYLYMSFDQTSYYTALLGAPLLVEPDLHTIKFGVNYRFGGWGGKGPVVAKY